MKKYQFTGHLTPLPPGVKLPIQISGDVYLPADVEAKIASLNEVHSIERARLNREIEKLRRKLFIRRSTITATPAARRGEG